MWWFEGPLGPSTDNEKEITCHNIGSISFYVFNNNVLIHNFLFTIIFVVGKHEFERRPIWLLQLFEANVDSLNRNNFLNHASSE